MILRVFDLMFVLAAFAVVYGVPPLLVARRLGGCLRSRLGTVVLSAAMGLAVQAVIGLLWNHLVGALPTWEGMVYYGFWGLASLVVMAVPRVDAPSSRPPVTPCRASWALLLIGLSAVALRGMDGITHSSLGQSDAYSHLQFLRDVLTGGQIRNIVYPPGYSWCLALPVLTFNLDPYLVARYVGPFFGLLLVLTLYLMGRRHSGSAGCFAAVLAATCPLLYPLVKTGMGAFANQMGIFLAAAGLLLYLMIQDTNEQRGPLGVLLGTVWTGLCASVPLLFLNSGLIIGAHRLLLLAHARRAWLRTTLLIALLALPAIALGAYHFLRPGPLHINATAHLVTGIPDAPAANVSAASGPAHAATPAAKLGSDLLTPKRMGFGIPWMNAASLLLALGFGAMTVIGIRRSLPAWSLVGVWGLLTTMQTATGLLDFSLYQRGGWSLMIAVALGGGLCAAVLWDRGPCWFRGAMIGIAAAMTLWALLHPPAHRCITSGAEAGLVDLLRALDAQRSPGCDRPLRLDPVPVAPSLQPLDPRKPLALVVRRYTLFHGDQGNLADAILSPAARVQMVPVDNATRQFPACDQYLFLIDHPLPVLDTGLFGTIDTAQAEGMRKIQALLYKPNAIIADFAASLPAPAWTRNTGQPAAGLTAITVTRIKEPGH